MGEASEEDKADDPPEKKALDSDEIEDL